jgi:hypothetical protein
MSKKLFIDNKSGQFFLELNIRSSFLAVSP